MALMRFSRVPPRLSGSRSPERAVGIARDRKIPGFDLSQRGFAREQLTQASLAAKRAASSQRVRRPRRCRRAPARGRIGAGPRAWFRRAGARCARSRPCRYRSGLRHRESPRRLPPCRTSGRGAQQQRRICSGKTAAEDQRYVTARRLRLRRDGHTGAGRVGNSISRHTGDDALGRLAVRGRLDDSCRCDQMPNAHLNAVAGGALLPKTRRIAAAPTRPTAACRCLSGDHADFGSRMPRLECDSIAARGRRHRAIASRPCVGRTAAAEHLAQNRHIALARRFLRLERERGGAFAEEAAVAARVKGGWCPSPANRRRDSIGPLRLDGASWPTASARSARRANASSPRSRQRATDAVVGDARVRSLEAVANADDRERYSAACAAATSD